MYDSENRSEKIFWTDAKIESAKIFQENQNSDATLEILEYAESKCRRKHDERDDIFRKIDAIE